MNFEKLYDKIKLQLSQIGLKNGDTLLVRADLPALGKLSRNRIDYVRVFLDILGDTGTLITLGFTQSTFIIKNKNYIFDGTQSAYKGAFANTMLQDKDAQRSKHPTNSEVAIGNNAKKFVDGLYVERRAYHIARRAMEVYAKVFPIGISKYLGFVTHLGLARFKIVMAILEQIFFKSTVKIYKY